MRARVAQGADAGGGRASRRVVDPDVQARRDNARTRERQRADSRRDIARRNAEAREKRGKRAADLEAAAVEMGLGKEALSFVRWLLKRGSREWLGDEDSPREPPANASTKGAAMRSALQDLIRRCKVSSRRVRFANEILAARDACGLVQDEAYAKAQTDFMLCEPSKRRGPRSSSTLRAAIGVIDAALARAGIPSSANRRFLSYRMAQFASGEGKTRGRGDAARYVADQTKQSDQLVHARRLRRAEIAYREDMEGLLRTMLAMAEAGDECAAEALEGLIQRDGSTETEGISVKNPPRKRSIRHRVR